MLSSASSPESPNRPRVLVTLGDVAGIGPEIVCKAWRSGELHHVCRPVIVGSPARLQQVLNWLAMPLAVEEFQTVADWDRSSSQRMMVYPVATEDLTPLPLGKIAAAAGQAAYAYLAAAIELALSGRCDAIVTCPIHKEALRLAGVPFPGHTEILAQKTGTPHFAMMLFGAGIGVTHVSLHVRLRDIFSQITSENVITKIRLTHRFLSGLLGQAPKIGVCGLNPHASDGGLFGDEEAKIIAPAVAAAHAEGIQVSGPWPSDTLFLRARQGEFQGIIAQYHDQGHIPMKLLAGWGAVNISLGLPLIRTSVAHGTAFDIAAQFRAEPTSLIEATRVAARLCQNRLVAAPAGR